MTPSQDQPAKPPASAQPPSAGDVIVLVSGGFRSSYQALVPALERSTGTHFVMEPSPSEGDTHDAVARRLERGEPADVLVMVGAVLEQLEASGYAVPGSKVDLALSPIGCAVRAGAAVPDISTADTFRAALLAAKSVAYSDSASGQYIRSELFKKLGIESQMRGRARQIAATPVGEVVARGEAEIGFQEVAELLPVQGITFAGRIPAELELLTVFSAGIAGKATHPAAAKRLIAYLASPEHERRIREKGLEPMPRPA